MQTILHFDKGLAGATVNKAINCGKKAVEYLYKKKLISENPFLGVERFAPNGIERGIPTETEVKELMKLDWESKVGKLAFTLSTFTGLRAGEISGLQVCDIDLDAELLHLRHSWNVVDKLKGLKNGETRSVPCDRETLMQLLFHARRNPMYSDTSFVFWSSQKPEQPFHPNYYEESFYDSLHKIGVSEEQRQERVLVFHSLRHFCATLLRQRMDLATVQEIASLTSFPFPSFRRLSRSVHLETSVLHIFERCITNRGAEKDRHVGSVQYETLCWNVPQV